MPPKISPNDWDRLFRPGAPRRGGPARALANLLMVGAVIGLLGGGAFFALRFGLQRAQESMARTAERGNQETKEVRRVHEKARVVVCRSRRGMVIIDRLF